MLVCRTAKNGKKARVENREDTPCEPKGASRKKIEMMGAADRVGDGMEQSWILAHVFQLTRLLKDVSCPTCGETGLYISVCEGSEQRAGFASKLALTCDLCKYQNFEMSSPRTQFSDKKNVAYEINPRMVVFSHEVGGSFAVLEKFGAVMGMPTMHVKTFQGHDKKVTGTCLICFKNKTLIWLFKLIYILTDCCFFWERNNE
jgi:hypothetical protein